MTININIEETKDFATVLLTNDGKTISKKIPLTTLSESFQNLIAAQKDTGYLNPNLLREVVKNTVCRAFYFKEYITDFKYSSGRDYIRAGNKFNIKYHRSNDESYMLIPNFKFTNILGFISNSNTEVFNPSFYQIYSVTPNIFGSIDDNSKLVRFFPNQFDENICWPREFNKDILKNRDLKIQSTFITQYLSSKFNTDLFRHKLKNDELRIYDTELDSFFQEVCGRTSSQIKDQDSVGWFYLVYFFLVNIKNIEPAVLASDSGTLKRLFEQRA